MRKMRSRLLAFPNPVGKRSRAKLQDEARMRRIWRTDGRTPGFPGGVEIVRNQSLDGSVDRPLFHFENSLLRARGFLLSVTIGRLREETLLTRLVGVRKFSMRTYSGTVPMNYYIPFERLKQASLQFGSRVCSPEVKSRNWTRGAFLSPVRLSY